MDKPNHMRHHVQQGFTLIELMIVVAIVAIIASLAYPAYTDSILKGKRAEGRTALTELMQQQERYMTQRNCYLGFTSNGSVDGTPTAPSPSAACGGTTASFAALNFPFKTFSGSQAGSSAYLLSAEACPTISIQECVRVLATPTGSDPAANVMRMTSTGIKDCTGTKPTLCWK